MKVQLLFLILLIKVTSSCTKELKYTKEDMLKMAMDKDPKVSVILPKNMNEGVTCSDYPDGCLSAHIVRVKNLDMIAVEFISIDQAKYAAKKIRGFYSRNWVFDDVTGEPSLEKFVSEALEAKKP